MEAVLRDVAIGLAVLFLGFAAAATVIVEGASRVLGWRAANLWGWARTALDGDRPKPLAWLVSALPWWRGVSIPANSPRAGALHARVHDAQTIQAKRIDNVPAQDFARAALNVLDPGDGLTWTAELESKLTGPFKAPLKRILDEAGDDVSKFVDRLGNWFDDQMADLARLYRRNMRWIAAIVGVVLAMLFNLNSLDAFDVFKNDAALRAVGVEAGSQITKECKSEAAGELNVCVGKQADKLFSTRELVEWLGLFDHDNHGRRFQKHGFGILGVVLSGLLISLGAPFWRDTIKTLTGRRPAG